MAKQPPNREIRAERLPAEAKVSRQDIGERYIALSPTLARQVKYLTDYEFVAFVRGVCRDGKQFDRITEDIDLWDDWARWFVLLELANRGRIPGVYQTSEEATAAAALSPLKQGRIEASQRKAS
jgi:hypothetical protein